MDGHKDMKHPCSDDAARVVCFVFSLYILRSGLFMSHSFRLLLSFHSSFAGSTCVKLKKLEKLEKLETYVFYDRKSLSSRMVVSSLTSERSGNFSNF